MFESPVQWMHGGTVKTFFHDSTIVYYCILYVTMPVCLLGSGFYASCGPGPLWWLLPFIATLCRVNECIEWFCL